MENVIVRLELVDVANMYVAMLLYQLCEYKEFDMKILSAA